MRVRAFLISAAAAAFFAVAITASASDPVLRIVAQDATTVTLGWDPVSGAEGFRFSSSGSSKRSHTWDGNRTSVRFAKADGYMVERIDTAVVGVYPAPPPVSGTWRGSFDASYQAAQPGDTIVVPAGTYPGETIRGSKATAVTFTMGGPVTVSGTLRIEANGVSLLGGRQMKVTYLLVAGGTNVKADGIDGTHFDVFDTQGPVAITNGDWGPCQAPRDDPSCISRIGSGSNVIVEGNAFHDITSTDLANYHVDGMAVFGGANNVVRRNRYFGNMITNIRVQNCCGNPQISNLVIEGNSFAAAVSGQGAKNANGIDIDTTVPGLKIRFNSFEQGTYIQNTAPSNSGAEYTGNLYSHVSCLSGVTYAYNVFVPWSDTQGQSGCSSTDTKVASLGYAVFPGLSAVAPGINRGGLSCFAFDLGGNPRPQGGACDAGAVEAGG